VADLGILSGSLKGRLPAQREGERFLQERISGSRNLSYAPVVRESRAKSFRGLGAYPIRLDHIQWMSFTAIESFGNARGATRRPFERFRENGTDRRPVRDRSRDVG
jgi:hypothetical protein